MKITKDNREAIVKKAIAQKYEKMVATFAKREAALATECYNHLFPKKGGLYT